MVRLQASQKDWYSQQSCASCHHQFLPALAFREARAHGIAVNEKIARADASEAFRVYADLDRAVEHANIVDPGIGDAYSLLAAEAAGVRPSIVTAVYARFLIQRQKPDGHWNTYDQRPPQSSSPVTATALAIRVARGSFYTGGDASARVVRARQWLLSRMPRDTEELAFQLMGLKWSGAEQAALAPHVEQIKQAQQSDGGWPELLDKTSGRASDAYSTGEILYALSEAGVAASDSAYTRGIEFLLKTQASDGTWHVSTRLYPPAPLSPDYFESGYPYGHDQMLSAMGASWAVMALSRALGPARKSELPALHEAAPENLEPWIQTALFGTEAELGKLLDAGLNPNAATKGGIALLMLAAPDAGKMKLLLDHGARANDRSHHGYSALMLAALYADATPALRLLLDRGAEVQASGSDPLYHAYPAVLAAIAGNAEGVALLDRAGDGVNAVYNYAGLDQAPPLILLSTYDDTAVMRALLDAGARVDEHDEEGLTPLHWAVLSNQVANAELLIEHGADVNRVDRHGMTPLLYAASIDFGDSRMVDLLLRHGAKTDARTPDGLTALDRARKYGHTRFFKSLEH